MRKLKIFIILVSVLLSGCQMREESVEFSEEVVYSAVMEDFGIGTKTTLNDRRILWSSGDRIIVFEGSDSGKAFELDEAFAGLSCGEFIPGEGSGISGSGEELGATVALYPYSEDLSVSAGEDGTLIVAGIKFPSEQHYTPGSFDAASFPMASVTRDNDYDLSFLNLGGVMKLSLRGLGNVGRITVRSNDGEYLSGSASVCLSLDSLPYMWMEEDASETVSLVCDIPVQLSEEEAVEFYISLPPVSLMSGFEVVIEDADGNCTIKRTDRRNLVKRSGILSMPGFSLSENEKTVDLGLSVKWAAWNVGATKPQEYGGFYSWGEIEPKKSFSKNAYQYYDTETKLYKDIGSDISGTVYDVASVKWGNGWRMPTMYELKELVRECQWTEVEVDGVGGHKVVGPSGASIFIPNTGYWQNSSHYFADDYLDGNAGSFWSATLSADKDTEAYMLNCQDGMATVNCRYWNRYFGMPVRPVKD